MALFALPAAPFEVPTDRALLPSARRIFVETHRTCVVADARRETARPGLSRRSNDEL